MIIKGIELVSNELTILKGTIALARITQVDDGDALLHNADGTLASNYVMIYKDEESLQSIEKVSDLVTLFGFLEDDIPVISEYVKNGLCANLHLGITDLTNNEKDSSLIFYNNIDADVIAYQKENKIPEDKLIDTVNEKFDAGKYAQAFEHSFARTLFIELLQTIQRRYNVLNFYDKVNLIADIIRDCRFMNEEYKTSTLTLIGVENLLKEVNAKLTVNPTV
jgi:hypothetical protein